MSKLRVYEVARDLGLPNRDLIHLIQTLGIQVRNHMSVLDVTDVERVKRAVEKDKAEAKIEEKIRPTVTRRRTRRKKVDAAPVEVVAETAAAEPAVEAPAAAPVEPDVVEAKAPEVAPVVEEPRAEPVVPPPADEPVAEPVVAAPPVPKVEVEYDGDEYDTPAEAEFDTFDDPSEAPEFEPTPPPRVSSPLVDLEQRRDSPERKMKAAVPVPRRPPTVPPPPDGRRKTLVPAKGVGTTKRALTPEERKKIVEEHQASRPARRVVKTRSSIGPQARPQGTKKKRLPQGRKPKQTELTTPSARKRIIQVEGQISLKILAERMSLKAMDLLGKLMQMGVTGVMINSTLDMDTATIIADEFGFTVENVALTTEEVVDDARGEFLDDEGDRTTRAPIVTIMGHVDHGKTSLLDKIRAANVADGEAGGITQHISAFRVETAKGTVVFLDTPGHEAFTAMRARGAQATDVVILVAAADDGVMPQTREAVAHSQAAGVPIIVAVNKIDKPGAAPDKVMNELASLGLTPEEWGGDTMFIPTSAITGEGIDKLLDGILLQAEVLELTANPNIPAEGVVLEAKLDRGRGVVANVLVRDGSIDTGDYVVAGSAWGRIRALTDDRGQKLKTAGPATPVELLGLDSMPDAGEFVYKVTNAKKAQEVAEANKKGASKPVAMSQPRGLEHFQDMLDRGEQQELQLVVKADVHGSIEALRKSLEDLSTDRVVVKLVHTGVGGITENDVMLAGASEGLCIIIGFNVRPQGKASSMAKKNGVEIRHYSVIYEALDEMKLAMAGLLAPKVIEKDLGKAEVRQTFSIPKIGLVAGCMVQEGKMQRSAQARLVRDGVIVWSGKLASLRRVKEDVKEVANGFECGIGLENFNDVKVGDHIECFEKVEVAATLEDN